MCAEASQASRDAPLVDSTTGIGGVATERMDCAGGCVPGPGRDRRRVLCALACAISGVVVLAFLLFYTVTGIEVAPVVETLCPIVGLPGILGSDGRSFFRRWIRRRIEENDMSPPGEHAGTDGETDVLERPEKIPEGLRRFESAASLGEAETLPDLPPRHGPDDGVSGDPDELPEPPPDDRSTPRSESLSDEELMRLLGFDGGADEPSPGIIELDACLTEDDPGSDEPVTAVFAPHEDRPVESLIDDLGSADAEVRGRAMDAVAKRGTDAVAPLIRALARADDGRRWCVAEALALMGEEAIPALIAALGDDAAQTGAAATLVRIGGPAVPPLIAALAGDDGDVQFGSLYALREIGDEAVPSLVGALDAPDGNIRRSVAGVLRELGWRPPDDAGAIRYLIAGEAWLDVAEYGEAAVGPLIGILKSPDREAWWNAARTLGEVGEVAVGPLVDLLHEADNEVRRLVVMALAEIGSPAVGSLIRLLSDPSLCSAAATAILKIGEPAAEACIQALDSPDGEAQGALREVLGALGEAAIPPLIQALTAGRSRVRGHVADILDGMGWEPWSDAERAWYLIAREQWVELALMGAPAVVPLIRTLNGDDDQIRSEAAATLGEIGLSAAVGPLVGALADSVVAPAAADALVAIGRPAVAPALALLEGGTDAARENAVEVLGRLGAHEAVPAIVEIVRSDGGRLHRKAVDALVGIGAPAIGALIPLLGEDGDGQAGATAALTGIGDAAHEPLVEALGDENARIRMGAAMILKRAGWVPPGVEEQAVYLIALQQWPDVAGLGAPAVDLLVARLADRDTGVQVGAAESLARIGAPAAPPLVRLLGEEAHQGPVGDILVRIGEAAVEPLIRALDEETLRRAAAGALVRIGGPAAGALITALGRSDSRQVAADVLIAMGEPSVDALVLALANGDALVRQRAGDVLIDLGDVSIGPLIGALGHPDDTIRLEAIDTLIRVGRQAVTELREALQDERYRVRLGAAEALGRVGWVPETEGETVNYLIAKEQWTSVAEIGSGAVEPLIRTLNDPDSAIQMGAARALGMIGAPAVMRLIHELHDEQDGERRKAVEALKMIGEAAVVPLIDALQDRDWHTRLGAARALVGIGDPAVEPLVRALRSGPPAVQMGAAAALGKIGNPAALEPLTDTLLHGDSRVGRVVVRALGMMGEMAVEALLSVLEEGNDAARKGAVAALVLVGEPAGRLLPGALADGHFRVRAGAADALDCLGWSPGPEEEEMALYLIAKERWSDLTRMGSLAVEPLLRVLNDRDDSIRRRAAKALGEVCDPRAVPALMDLLHDDYYSIRREAAAALVAIGAPAMGPTISALGDRDSDVRKRAADVLSEIGDARAVEALRGIFSDEDWYVQRAAEEAVEKIRGRTGECR